MIRGNHEERKPRHETVSMAQRVVTPEGVFVIPGLYGIPGIDAHTGLPIASVPPSLDKVRRQWQEAIKAPAEWRKPIFLDDSAVDAASYMSESDMDWDEEEMVTQPGISNPNVSRSYDQGEAFVPPPPTPSVYPKLDGEDLDQHTTRCYLCAGKNVARFTRAPGDGVIVCGHCLYHHLGWEVVPGSLDLRKVPAE